MGTEQDRIGRAGTRHPVAAVLAPALALALAGCGGGSGGGSASSTDGAFDADADGVPDAWQPRAEHRDSDGDGLPDDLEVLYAETDPTVFDTDGDGLGDGIEIVLGTSPLRSDSDGDGTSDGAELDPDGDGVPDDLLDARDPDRDGIPSRLEPPRTAPDKRDTDDDGAHDGIERIVGTDPTVADTDRDGYRDGWEIEQRTDPLNRSSRPERQEPGYTATGDADDDGVIDDVDLAPFDPTNDSDGDGVPNVDDAAPLDPSNDTDGDGVANEFDPAPFDDTFPRNIIDPNADPDGDGLINNTELDWDPRRGFIEVDTDMDGTPDHLDIDSDDDGLGDGLEGAADADGDGKGNFRDPDSDDDGVADGATIGNSVVEGLADQDGDGRADFVDADNDSDGDGFPNPRESQPLDVTRPRGLHDLRLSLNGKRLLGFGWRYSGPSPEYFTSGPLLPPDARSGDNIFRESFREDARQDPSGIIAQSGSIARPLSLHLIEDLDELEYGVRARFAPTAEHAGFTLPLRSLRFIDSGLEIEDFVERRTPDATSAGAKAGWSVSLAADGSRFAAGVPHHPGPGGEADSGAVAVFDPLFLLRFEQSRFLRAPAPAAGAEFGRAVALSGDGATLAVGAPGQDGTGAVFVYDLAGSDAPCELRPEPIDTQPPGFNSDVLFGESVALSSGGRWLAVGMPGYLDSTGAVRVYDLAGSCGDSVRLQASDAGPGDRFGEALDLSTSGQVLVVGAPNEDTRIPAGTNQAAPISRNDAGRNVGAAYVFTADDTDGDGVVDWPERDFLKPRTTFVEARIDDNGDSRFGTSVAVTATGEAVFVGMPFHDHRPGTSDERRDAGAVEAFLRSGTDQWAPVDRILAREPAASARLGGAVATSDTGARIAVGAAAQGEIFTPAIDGSDTGAARFGVGAVHVFRYENPDQSWEPLSQVQAPNLGNCAAAAGTGCTDRFGRSVSLTGDGGILAVGAPRDDAEDGSRVPPQDTGAIYLY